MRRGTTANGSVVTMTTVAEVISTLERRYPLDAQEDWDVNSLTVGSRDAIVRHVHFAVDPTLAVVREAADAGASMLVTHHPLMLRGVTSVAFDTAKGAIVREVIASGIALYNAHTNADAADGGVADAFARAIGVAPTGPLVPNPADPAVGTGRVGTLERTTTLRAFAAAIAAALPPTAHGVRVAGDLDAPIHSVAVVGGSGDAFLQAARDAGVDAYVTADLRHHPASDARELANLGDGRPHLLDVSHFASEWAWLADAAALIADVHDVATTVSHLNTDPWTARFDAQKE
jgi:dinuclear metal center YbgI/SA1388 family protein